MLGCTHRLPSLTLLALLALPFTSQGQDDPFTDVTPEQQPAASAGEGPDAGDNAQAASGAAGTAAPAAADNPAGSAAGSSLEDEYGFDPAAEFGGAQDSASQDPWEGVNRAVFRFNDAADRWFLKPVSVTYREVTPIFMQSGFSNFYGNLGEITNSLNSVLQWKWRQAGNDAGRFLINSTVGVAGLFDVAQHWGLDPNDGEDFGQTLAVWGVPAGPYVVLPLLGPYTVRDVPGGWVDFYTNPMAYVDHERTQLSFLFGDMVQTRASYLSTESLLQGDRYVLLRDAYLQRREFLIKDGASSHEDTAEGGAGGDSATETGAESETDPFAF
ncbi:hypothetical protein Maes01_00617 [Microbulbifer aestuariivivens]|uniref:VacJ family lipoprotein n=1 Tax=Microbulbifer aestuariivivens TaxID=1908308 RepID=A0ABP9WM20_9GAMM